MALSKKKRFEILQRDGFKCQYCGAIAPEVKLHVDHTIPRILARDDSDENLITACSDCNLGKKAMYVNRFMMRLVYLNSCRQSMRPAKILGSEEDVADWHSAVYWHKRLFAPREWMPGGLAEKELDNFNEGLELSVSWLEELQSYRNGSVQ